MSKGFKALRAELNGFLVHLLSHRDQGALPGARCCRLDALSPKGFTLRVHLTHCRWLQGASAAAFQPGARIGNAGSSC